MYMQDIIVLNKDQTYSVVSEDKFLNKYKKDPKFVLFPSDTATKANVFSMVKGKNVLFQEGYSYIIRYILLDMDVNTVAEFKSAVVASSLAKQYSILPLIYQYFNVYSVMDISDDIFPEDLLVEVYNPKGKHEATYSADGDDLDVYLAQFGVTSDVFDIFFKADTESRVLVLYGHNKWDIWAFDYGEYYNIYQDNIMYIGIPSYESDLVTLVSKYEYNLLLNIREIEGIMFLQDNDSEFYLGSCNYTSLQDILTLLIFIPQALRLMDASGNMLISRYVIGVYLKSEPTEFQTSITIEIDSSQIWSDDLQLLPILIDALEEYNEEKVIY